MSGIKTKQDLDDFVRGATLYGTGGGGSQAMGKNLLLQSFNEGKEISWINIADIDETAWVCTALYMGSIAPLTDEDKKRMQELGLVKKVEQRVLVTAVKELEQNLAIEISAIIPVELGGLNSSAPLDAAAQMGKKVVDGDLAGRAVPEIAQTLPRIVGYPICPIACCDAWGDVSIIKKTHGYDSAEALGKMLSIPAYEPIGLACFAMRAKDAKLALVDGSLTKCLNTGIAVREARDGGQDPVYAFASTADGKVIFRGKVTAHNWKSKDGYMYGNNDIEGGKGEFEGKQFRIWFKNENHITWLDGNPYVTSPDLIQAVDMHTGEPLTNTDIAVGLDVAVVAIPNPKYRTKEGIDLLGPSHFGFNDIQYRPMEEILG
ncbi:MAG TPA: DUF917 domain-containing protein [Candidatus Deferrimicrobium sp.]|nr:DUF917 domain-containing protein [Candidatus Deferrimicrobium sp.]